MKARNDPKKKGGDKERTPKNRDDLAHHSKTPIPGER